MVASLKFYTDSGKGTEATADLSDAKVVVYEDGNDNKYTLDASNIAHLTKIDDIKLSTLKDVVFKYQPKSGSETTTTGLGSIIGTLLSTQSAQDGKTILAEEVVKKPVVDALIPELAKDDGTTGIYTKKGVDDELAKKADTAALADKADKTYVDTELGKKANSADLAAKASTADVYTKQNVDDELAKKADIDGTNLDDAKVTAILNKLADKVIQTSQLETPAVAGKVLDAQDGKKSILVNKLGEALDRVQDTADDKVYGAVGHGKIAKDFLADKYPFAKIDASNLTDAANKKAFAEAILPAKDGNKSILVDKLGGFLDSPDKAKYDGQNNQTVQEFLVGKGLKGEKGDTGEKGADGKDGTSPSAAEIAAEQALQEHVAKISIESPEFKRAVQEEMSQPRFDIPASDDAALNWTW